MSDQFEMTLTIQNGPQTGQNFKITGGSQTIGRTARNQIVITDPTVSKQHARLSLQAGRAIIEDLGSANGTFVNGQRITGPVRLKPGDTMLLGSNIKLVVSQAGGGGTAVDPGPTYLVGPQAAPAPPAAFILAVQRGPQPGQTFALSRGIQTIGRAQDNSIQLADSTVSKRHARLTVQADGVYLQDLGSANGTFVNGQQISGSTLLRPGDVIQVGTFVTLGLQGPGLPAAAPSVASAASAASAAMAGPAAAAGRRGGWGWLVAVIALVAIVALGLAAWLLLAGGPAGESQPESAAQVTVLPSPSPVPPTATPLPPATILFNADRTSLQLGECLTLRWQVEGAKEARLDGESVPLAGERQLCPQEPQKTYRLTALSLAGETREQAIMVTVLPTPPPPPELALEFSADRNSVELGQCTILRWRVENAQEVRLAGDKVGATGTEQVCPTEPVNSYKLVIQPLEGPSLEQVVTINVPPTPTPVPTATSTPVPPTATAKAQPQLRAPVIDQFIADQYNLNQGGCTSLRWSVRNAQSVQLSGGEIGSQSVGNDGARQVCPPAASTTYNLVATGAGGSDQRTLTISLTGGQLQPGGSGTLPGGSGPYAVRIGNHIYEQPWGAARGGDVCQTYRDHSWDDEKPFYRGFNVELLLTNNSTSPVPDDWGEAVDYVSANGKGGEFCYYGYDGAGPPPGATSSLTFFALVDQGDYVRTIHLTINGQRMMICLDGAGAQAPCQ